MTWQPIDRFDGRCDGILLYDEGYPGQIMAARWSEARGDWVMFGLSSVGFNDIEPTHWMPLPDAPE